MEDVVVFAALPWERRAVSRALGGARRTGRRTWAIRVGADGAGVLVETGMGAERARHAALAAPAARAWVAMGCAGALVGWLRRGQVVAASEVVVLDADGRAAERLPAGGADVAAAAAAHGVRLVPGAVAVSGALVATAAGKAAAAESGAVVVDMESGALAAVARARGIPFVALRAVLDLADEALPFGTDAVDERTGALRLGRTVAALAPPARWRLAWRLFRGRRAAARALGVAAQCLPADAAPAPDAARRSATA